MLNLTTFSLLALPGVLEASLLLGSLGGLICGVL